MNAGSPEAVPWIATVAARTGLRYEPDADERWLRAWEPYTTLRGAQAYKHALHATGDVGSVSISRMTTLSPRGEARCWCAIVQDTRILATAAATSDVGGIFGEPFDLIAMPRRPTGDPAFDHVFATFAHDQGAVRDAFNPSLRKLLLHWRTPVHAELRPGGFVLAPVAVGCNPEGLTWLLDAIKTFGDKASKWAP